MKKSKLRPDEISIVDIKIIKGEIDSPVEFRKENIVGHSFQLDYDVGFNPGEKLARSDIKVEIRSDSEGNDDEARSYFHISYLYHIDNLDELAKPVEGTDELEIDGNLGNALASITYSTTRGILLTRVQGTVLSDFVLPVIDPNDLINKELSNNN